jgi:hypothetical protein
VPALRTLITAACLLTLATIGCTNSKKNQAQSASKPSEVEQGRPLLPTATFSVDPSCPLELVADTPAMVQKRSVLGLSTYFTLRVTNSSQSTVVRYFRYLTEYRLNEKPLNAAPEEQDVYRSMLPRDYERLLITMTGYDEAGNRRVDSGRARVVVWIAYVNFPDREPWEDNGGRLCRATIQE